MAANTFPISREFQNITANAFSISRDTQSVASDTPSIAQELLRIAGSMAADIFWSIYGLAPPFSIPAVAPDIDNREVPTGLITI